MRPSCCFQGLVQRTQAGALNAYARGNAGGIIAEPTAELLADIANLDQQISLLADEINARTRNADVTTTTGQNLVRLLSDYTGFKLRWDVWSRSEQSDAWLLSAKSTLDEFSREFGQYRTRFTQNGGTTQTSVPVASNPLSSFAAGAGGVLASVIVASAIAGGAYMLFFKKD